MNSPHGDKENLSPLMENPNLKEMRNDGRAVLGGMDTLRVQGNGIPVEGRKEKEPSFDTLDLSKQDDSPAVGGNLSPEEAAVVPNHGKSTAEQDASRQVVVYSHDRNQAPEEESTIVHRDSPERMRLREPMISNERRFEAVQRKVLLDSRLICAQVDLIVKCKDYLHATEKEVELLQIQWESALKRRAILVCIISTLSSKMLKTEDQLTSIQNQVLKIETELKAAVGTVDKLRKKVNHRKFSLNEEKNENDQSAFLAMPHPRTVTDYSEFKKIVEGRCDSMTKNLREKEDADKRHYRMIETNKRDLDKAEQHMQHLQDKKDAAERNLSSLESKLTNLRKKSSDQNNLLSKIVDRVVKLRSMLKLGKEAILTLQRDIRIREDTIEACSASSARAYLDMMLTNPDFDQEGA